MTGHLIGIIVDVNIAGPLGDCGFDVTGSISGFLDPQFVEPDGSLAQQLTATGSQLEASNVDNVVTCLGLVNDGDPISLTYSANVGVIAADGDPIAGDPILITN